VRGAVPVAATRAIEDDETPSMMTELAQLWKFREVIQVLIGRDLRARYRGAALGFLWSVLNPLAFMLVYVLLFSVYMRIEVDHYAAFLLCGMLPWTWFAGSLNEASRSILDNRALVKKVALPSEIFPLATIGSGLVHFVLSLPVLLLLLLVLGVGIGWPLVLLPGVLLVQFVFTYGVTLITSAVAVRFRDLLQIVPNLLTLWFFLTPVLYPATMVPAGFRPLLELNPMAWLIATYQDILFYQRPPDLLRLGVVGLLAVVLLAAGHAVFRARREWFAEEL